jgi:rhodanese-related sulfurtransferase
MISLLATVFAVKLVSEHEAHHKISTGNITVVDVRSESAYVESHVKGAVLLSADGVQADLANCEEEEVAFYCSTTVAATQAAEKHESETGSAALALPALADLAAANVTTESGMPEQRVHCTRRAKGDDDASFWSGKDWGTVACIVGMAAIAALCLVGAAVVMCMRRSCKAAPARADAAKAAAKAAEIEAVPADKPDA